VLLGIMLFALLAPQFALHAHIGHGATNSAIVQNIGPYELRLALATTDLAVTQRKPIQVTVWLQNNPPAGTLTFATHFQDDQSQAGTAPASVRVVEGIAGPYYTQITANQAGAWIIDLTVSSDSGTATAHIPLLITALSLSPLDATLYGVMAAGVIAVIVVIVLIFIVYRLGRQLSAWAFAAIAAVFVALVSVGGTVAAQQASGFALLPATTTAQGGRPFINLAMRRTPAQPVAGQPVGLTFTLTDGATGRPADDLVLNHEAFVHLIVISDDNQQFSHLHPARVGEGIFAISFVPPQAGLYNAYLEVTRQDSGTQLLHDRFTVGAADAGAPAPDAATSCVPRCVIDDLAIDVQMTPITLDQNTTLTLTMTRGGEPVRDLEPWLGMAGHMVARSADGAVLAHVHAVGQMLSSETALTAARFGPTLQFVNRFPAAGAYRMWVQFKRANRLYTVPIQIDVTP
jgi:hypothetical protein